MKTRVILILAALLLIVIPSQVIAAPTQTLTIPTFTITAVDEDNTVTISAINFPPNQTFNVTMGAYGTMGIGGYSAGTQNSGTGTFTATYTIPTQMVGAARIAIRLKSTSSGYYSYNWFWNSDHPDPVPSPSPDPGDPTILPAVGLPPGGSGTIPNTTITDVTTDTDVTAKGGNFPTSDTLNVYIGHYGTKGVGGTLIGTQPTDASGTFTATYNIPAAYHGQNLLAIRWVSPTTGYFAYDWFTNTTGTPSSPTASFGYPPNGKNTHPLTTITAVSQGSTVTIKGTNFTTNDSYQVLISAYGTLGVGGTNVATQTTDGTGAFTATYNIPAGLAGATKLAIRLQSASSGYYAYDWFVNSNSP